ncbi:DUF3426 domain-containing protein [Aestuariirhabdus litorea]|uniref:DUF3426 domain-containing protein n=1 Tax=Aestuariirhabdus litorea TaxID=2528527 RepID=A0A3P3VIW0_9GAMM|nr:DUF3426 domain-containing protein [Aestuariirhabdus litorea]RRJ82294.1 DUF3426 domain-containing protein [Aestuariirhabdus litorea]RWW92460.1 DUF3426 domain-containing protein [Endozoicomonadaceae bacterium GTF-13]
MSKTWVTRCPQCQTAFRLTRAQLQAANGSVRCGSCLHVFKATNHIVGQPDSAPAPAPAAAPKTPPPAPARPATPPVSHPEQPREEFELSDDFQSLDAWTPERTSTFSHDSDKVGDEAADESWAMAMLEEMEKEHQPAPPQATAKPAPKPTPAADDGDWGLDGEPDFSDSDLSTFDEINRMEASHPQSAPPADEMSGLRADRRVLHGLNEEPLNLHLPEQPARWKRVLTGLASLLAAAALLLQYAWYDRDRLARQDSLRPYYQLVCDRAGCSLPEKVNIAAIRGTNLVVRSHPRFENALMVDAIISNQANYSQPFPAIQISFSDLSGNPVASRRFTPTEYLAGELAGTREMPSHTPIHLALEIVDPGQKAVNYHLDFFPAP